MNVRVRQSRGERLIRRRFRTGEPLKRPVIDAAPISRKRRHDPAQDQALYTCSCGYVFEAQVSTSVGCPNCGDRQAW